MERFKDLRFPACFDDEVQVIGVVRAIAEECNRRNGLTVSRCGVPAQWSNTSKQAGIVVRSQNTKIAAVSVDAPPGPEPLPREEDGVRRRVCQQLVPLSLQA